MNPPDDGHHTVVISTGDVAGVSPELIPSLLAERQPGESFVFTGPESLRASCLDRLNRDRFDDDVTWLEAGSIARDRISSGSVGEDTGEAAYRSLRRALEVCRDRGAPLLTLPLSKAAVQRAGHSGFVGHTEELESFFDCRGVMSFFGEQFNVALITRHHPLRKVVEELREEKIVRTIRTVDAFFRATGVSSPSLALLGLNPHAGEMGTLGTEEENLLRPIVEELREEGIDVEGPHSADSFIPVSADTVDLIVACYHDQGLVPFKQEHFYSGVHATLGLPVLRVSPDHGVAAKLAGTGRLHPGSTVNALQWLRTNREPASSG